MNIRSLAIETLRLEAEAVSKLQNFVDQSFEDSVQAIYAMKGRLVVTGIGKSAIIAQKIVATMNSTGTPSVFMHAADAIHGDLGIIQPDDVVLCISKSGNTPEISVLIPFLKMNGNTLIALVGNTESFLAKEADHVLNCTVSQEACPNNLAPTCSSTAQLAMGDALASCLIALRGFTSKDFAKYHPGGVLGKRLYVKVEDLYKFNEKPQVAPDDSIQKVSLEISGKCLGVTAVVENGKVVGAITDGDLRRHMGPNILEATAADLMTRNPICIEPEALSAKAEGIMEKKKIIQHHIYAQIQVVKVDGCIHRLQ